MDVELLSKMISELMVDHDMVGLPGVGTFCAEVVPSTFSDKGYTINPPYRRLSFFPGARENDLLVSFYARVNRIPPEMAREYLGQFLAELAEVLKERKAIILPGLGRLRATKENNFFFVPDENLDIYPEGFGLAPVSLKSLPAYDDDKVEIPFEFRPHKPIVQPSPAAALTGSAITEPEGTASEPSVPAAEPAEPVAAVPPAPAAESAVSEPSAEPAIAEPVESGASADAVPIPETSAEPAAEPETSSAESSVSPYPAPGPSAGQESEPSVQEPAQPVPAAPAQESEEAAEAEVSPETPRFRWWVPLLVIVALAAIGLAAFLILAQVAPDFIDSILYTDEELRIINY